MIGKRSIVFFPFSAAENKQKNSLMKPLIRMPVILMMSFSLVAGFSTITFLDVGFALRLKEVVSHSLLYSNLNNHFTAIKLFRDLFPSCIAYKTVLISIFIIYIYIHGRDTQGFDLLTDRRLVAAYY